MSKNKNKQPQLGAPMIGTTLTGISNTGIATTNLSYNILGNNIPSTGNSISMHWNAPHTTINGVSFTGFNYPTPQVGIEYQLIENAELYLVSSYGVIRKEGNELLYERTKALLADTQVKITSIYEFLNMIVEKNMVR